jgi:hypothetical protein
VRIIESEPGDPHSNLKKLSKRSGDESTEAEVEELLDELKLVE